MVKQGPSLRAQKHRGTDNAPRGPLRPQSHLPETAFARDDPACSAHTVGDGVTRHAHTRRRRGAAARARLRRLPHRPARRRRRAARCRALPIVPGHEIVGGVEALGAGVDALARRRARRRALARLHLRPLRLCTRGRENLCDDAAASPATHCDGGFAEPRGRRRALLPAAAGLATTTPRPRRCCARADRLARAAGRPATRAAARPVRLRRGGAHDRAGRAVAGPAGLRVHAAGRHRRAGVRPRARRGMGRRLRRAAARGAGRGDHLRAGRRAGARGAAARCARAARVVCARHPHERHPVLSVLGCCGRSGSSCRSPTSRAATASEFLVHVPSSAAGGTHDLPATRANEALAELRTAGCKAPRCCCPERSAAGPAVCKARVKRSTAVISGARGGVKVWFVALHRGIPMTAHRWHWRTVFAALSLSMLSACVVAPVGYYRQLRLPLHVQLPLRLQLWLRQWRGARRDGWCRRRRPTTRRSR